MFTHVTACKNSNQSQKVYCKRHSIAYSTFQYWTKKYRKEYSEDKVSDDTPGFIPVEVQPDPAPDQVRFPNQLHFLFPNGIEVMCPSINVDILEPLLKIPNIKGMKTANLNLILHLLRNNMIRQDFSILYSGLDSFDVAIQAGIKKNLDGMLSCTPNNTRQIYQNIANVDNSTISFHLNNILALRNIFLKENVMSAFSYAMELLDCQGNYHPDYAPPISNKLKEDIYTAMKEIKEI